MSRTAFPILTWHSVNVQSHDYAGNDLLAFEQDLETLHRRGWRIVSLDRALDALARGQLAPRTAVLTSDDGCLLDWEDFNHPTLGRQGNLRRILAEFKDRHEESARHQVHLTAFVIASPAARHELDQTDYQGLGLWPDHWWADANQSGLISIENHSWDHNHGSLAETVQKDNRRGDFRWIASESECRAEIDQASDYIEQRSGRRPRFFAYPYGQSSDYLREEYLPRFGADIGLKAALSCEPEPVTRASNPWHLPRYVCGRDWNSPDAFEQLLTDLER
ncbi:MAG: polysaccharide deacetylase family protein [Wenzhouxiangella sp.]